MAAIKTAIPTRRFDAVIIGAGGSGMRASLQLAEAGLNVAKDATIVFKVEK